MGMALTLYRVFSPTPALKSAPFLMVTSTIFYGFRLGTYLLARQAVFKEKGDEMKATDKSPRLKRVPFAVSVGLFYAMMSIPNLYALRSGPLEEGTILATVSMVGAIMAWTGALIEAIADGHKFLVKKRAKEGSTLFQGPTGGLYRLVRFPNYFGEVLFWFGLFVGGAPTFGKSILAWISSALGLYGIFGIMSSASKRLHGKQVEKYKGQAKYDEWAQNVKGTLIPFLVTPEPKTE